MKDNIIPRSNYIFFERERQLVLPLDYGVMIPEDAPVRLLDAVLERMDYTKLLRLYSARGRKSAVPPWIFFKVVLYAAELKTAVQEATGIDVSTYSSHELATFMEQLCQEKEIPFVYGSGKRKHPYQRLTEEASA